MLIEFESPGSLTDKNGASANRRTIEQVQRYVEMLSRVDKQDLSRILGVATDAHLLKLMAEGKVSGKDRDSEWTLIYGGQRL